MANSKNVAERIRKFYRREPVIIYPPVDLEKARPLRPGLSKQGGYYLSVSRLVRGKGVETVVEACIRLRVLLKVVGEGPEMDRLKKSVGKTVEFLGSVKDEEMADIYGGAKATIVASEDEDFGIVPIESMACGTPVIALRAGGFLETVVEGKTGIFFDQANAEALITVLQNFDSKKYEPEDCRKQAEKFSKMRFQKEILELVEKNLHLPH